MPHSKLMKTCSNCGDTLPIDAFYKDTHRADGRQAVCGECQRTRHRDHRLVKINRLLKGWGRTLAE